MKFELSFKKFKKGFKFAVAVKLTLKAFKNASIKKLGGCKNPPIFYGL